MEKVTGVTDARNSFRKIINEVQYQGEKYIVERHGQPAVAIVPVGIYEQWKREQEELFELIKSFQESSGDNDPDEIMAQVLAAQQAIREQ
ncbi:MAG: type II toxin-antitoxin system Phd/YefM family antitoxin [Ardenticatenaceae bacterium]|nr:type II toxin-antitoxin system Phd/YefM family antitoxin [Ardenticatenaceae bacterium]MCB9446126.1 type II toxin-antitoxin system Phd/YefM family antitoxin [Ardenticatenaceae bacterium]